MSDTSGYAGVGFEPSVWGAGIGGQFNRLAFIFASLMNRVATATVVQVMGVTNNGDASPVGTVDVQPMVNQLDGQGQAKAHGTIYKLPYFRLQGGLNAVIIDPKVKDIGLAAFCHTDISAVKKAKKVSNPGSRRRFDWADGLYLGGFLNATPEQYLRFAGGMTAETPGLAISGNATVGSGWSGSFPTLTGQIVTVVAGIITDVT